ncbi:tRNA-specific 2-thiouridylase MnmA [Candidatus Terasakiella magnetica]|uniref:tRNA-specific 2-thiouridylase MnmA n=1 Tax=Candidatus Terasakiella magnetica TaxID=1867952 RepID=A0A1C3RLQ7_9PROT|nr:tRNA 2-thiouridine(34) synthase MnmA [Candidatus Terasakiella magnetica]SCA58079.1 tRNA-specific 2-thiouridylase MnmA [Candidatus Terasakiella magnetica]
MNSLFIDKAPEDTRVIVAMSGGVDSSVTAAMLKEEGYDVVGVTLQLYDHGEAVCRPNTCCAGRDIYDARRVADQIGIPHYVLDYEEVFKRDVMEYFAETYVHGETPIPCVKCNETVKFRDLLETAKDLGGDALVTGHYVQWEMTDQGAILLRGDDHRRDQSYFMFTMTQDQADYVRFPLGGMCKDETRELAKKFGLAVASKSDSQDICFVPEGKYVDVVEKLRPGSLEAGEIVHVDGTVVGKHDGIIKYTVGQRRGLGIAWPEPLYVIKLDAENKQVIVGPKEALMEYELTINGVNWIGFTELPDEGRELVVKVRSAQPPQPATVYPLEDGRARVTLKDGYAGIAPGQACVFYEGERMLGGGWIETAA